MCRAVVFVLGLGIAAQVAGQIDTVLFDPAPDRTLMVTTARTLPTDSSRFSIMASLTSGVWSHGITDRLMITVASPAWTIFLRTAIVGWNVKFRVHERDGLAVAIGDFGVGAATFEAVNSTTWMVHWPYVSVTVASPHLQATVNTGFGMGDALFTRPLGERTVVQMSLMTPLGRRALLFGEFTALYASYTVSALGVRVWDGRYFMDMGGVFNVSNLKPLPWFSIGGRL